jgi:integrase
MRKRFQIGCVRKSKDGRYWVGQYREEDETGERRHRSKLLGKVSKMAKAKALEKLADILKPINEAAIGSADPDVTVKDFVENIYLPFYRKKWKRITLASRTTSITYHVVGTFGERKLASLTRDELQRFLDDRKHLAFSMVVHLRWDMKQILDLANAEGVITKNPVYVPPGTMLLFVPRECRRPERPVLTIEQVKKIFDALDQRDRLIVKLGVIGGMRCSEIFGLRRGRIGEASVEIVERVCKRDIDTPKTPKSVWLAALSSGLATDIQLWLDASPDTGPEGWLFPSENLATPIGSENVLNRNIRPKLEVVSLAWVDYRVMRRTHASLMNEKGVDPKLVADQQGHTVDVNQNVYTQTSLKSRIEAVEKLESAFVN